MKHSKATANSLLKLESARARLNLNDSLKYRSVLIWIKHSLENNTATTDELISEIGKVLTE